MPDKITYYAVVDDRDDCGAPTDSYVGWNSMVTDSPTRVCGETSVGSLHQLSWSGSAGIFAYELVEVSHEQASKIIEYFREKWGPFGQPLDT